ncbi:3-dehydroshikimate dehydratase [Pyrenophora tritici-repentis]|uniref:3-dehydroshikimate dehydratase n=2 Tax=Pyrenophora tritici-repentis TaxID=45151 RepID=B2WGS3_PYRTR|nr:3-dehydroshikimate dehydratase [Pyrenophora tritici-repentis Pt-1C-BFP]KAA8627723.1 3-dehydroshikimate dehydratase [Pyrenophora tritici-repentis]EDU42180.1 3-dehydroshikimate dehydratase [Pyrenophora tritici-repentis Pt-1C-BFP]KAI0576076.1 3-dehydroshikimate dehydratase [Pyrenophora tritici-repentis]KAI0580361.1 3-dehydroshikimate dehydratase [Pyrenophora tritici-repentis]KAI0608701.1 3-dehydroshikimate dehydratase [Pyrenophora tritici-repentis]
MPCRSAISSMSLGRCYAGHSLNHKLSMAAKHGLEGIELFYEDLVDHAGSDSPAALLAGAASVRDLCCSLSLEIVCLQPFMHYEGLLDRQRHAERIEEMKLWMKLAHVLGTDLIQVPSSFLPRDQLSSDIDFIASDLREVAELGLKQTPVIRFAYESLSWGTVVDKWEVCWDIVSQVDRPNFGICLDSFNILGRIYADPTSETGMVYGAEQEVRDSICRLVDRIKPHREKIFFIQIVDAERLTQPLLPGHPFYNAEQPARMSWSRNCRLFYGETKRGAYLPVKDVTHAIIKQIGFDGWVSMELFNRVMNRTDETVVEELAERAGAAWNKIRCDLALDTATNDRSEHEGGPEHFVREPELARL